MTLDKKDIEHIAKLARLKLSDREIEKYRGELSDILKYINLLQEVDVKNIEPTAQVTGLEDVFRDDKIEDWNRKEREDALKQAPGLENGQIKVKRILE